MTGYSIYRVALGFGALVLMPSLVQAQDSQTSFDQVRDVVKRGEIVRVVARSGEVIPGRILDISSATLGLQVGDQRREFAIDDVQTISRRRHANVGVGAAIGFGAGLVAGFMAVGSGSDCRECVTAIIVGFSAAGTGVGAAIAAANIREQVIFLNAGPAARLNVQPIIGPRRTGVLLTARW